MNGHSEPTTMEKLRGPNIVKRGDRFFRIWKHQAPDQENFAGIDYQELHAEVDGANAARGRILAVESWLHGLRLERDQADRKLAKKLIRVACGIRAEPAFGEDCGVYRALGFVPLSENRSRRPQKEKTQKAWKARA
jgi:hypothetical protein